jgi:hypothetical protein
MTLLFANDTAYKVPLTQHKVNICNAGITAPLVFVPRRPADPTRTARAVPGSCGTLHRPDTGIAYVLVLSMPAV